MILKIICPIYFSTEVLNYTGINSISKIFPFSLGEKSSINARTNVVHFQNLTSEQMIPRAPLESQLSMYAHWRL